MLGEFSDDAKAEPDCLLWVIDTRHHLVADRLDLFRPMLREQLPYAIAELLNNVGRTFVAMSLSESRVTREIREQKSVRAARNGHRKDPTSRRMSISLDA
jgi:hypothetical protein